MDWFSKKNEKNLQLQKQKKRGKKWRKRKNNFEENAGRLKLQNRLISYSKYITWLMILELTERAARGTMRKEKNDKKKQENSGFIRNENG